MVFPVYLLGRWGQVDGTRGDICDGKRVGIKFTLLDNFGIDQFIAEYYMSRR